MVEFIDDHREAHGVEPICKVLPIAPSTYYDHLAKRADPARLSDRARRDAALRPEIERVFEENWRVYGVRKIWRQLDREGFAVARCTVARLMKGMGIQGARHCPRTNGGQWLAPRQAAQDDHPRQERPMPAGQGEPAVPRACAEYALGQRFHLRRYLERLRLRGIRHRRLRAPDCRLAGEPNSACGLRPRCPRTGRP